MLMKIDPKEIRDNVFSAIGKDWMLITAETEGRCNTMTASWGGLGVLWGKNVATIYVRHQRYTYEFVEGSDYFTLCFFPDGYRETLDVCGTKSGRDMDKIAHCGLTVCHSEQGNAPYFAEARLVLVCSKLYAQDFDPEKFLDGSIVYSLYGERDFHRMYVGEIVEVLEQR